MYADKITKSMQQAIDETERRREIQTAYNQKHDITPETIRKAVPAIFDFMYENADDFAQDKVAEAVEAYGDSEDLADVIERLEKEMRRAAKLLEFEKAAELRDQIRELEKRQGELPI